MNLKEITTHPLIREIVNAPAERRTEMWEALSQDRQAPWALRGYADCVLQKQPFVEVSYLDAVGGGSGQTRMPLHHIGLWLAETPGRLIREIRFL